MIAITSVAAILLALVHLLAGMMRFYAKHHAVAECCRSLTSSCPSSLSSAGGKRRSCRSRARLLDSSSITSSSYHYWVSVVFYGLERLAKSSRQQTKMLSSEDQTSTPVFCIHITSFTAYTGLVGCLLLHLEIHTSKSCFLLRCDGLTLGRQRF